jgi:hypothetical protein
MLRARGWTRRLIERFLPKPDATPPNIQNRSGPEVKLYDRKRVEMVERREDFQAAKEQAATRKASAARAIATKRERTLEYIRGVVIEVPTMEEDEPIRRVCNHYNVRRQERQWEGRRASDSRATPDPDDEFLERITVNYLRHQTTGYDAEGRKIKGKVGVDDAHDVLREEVYNAISEAYTWLELECDRQCDDRRERQRLTL